MYFFQHSVRVIALFHVLVMISQALTANKNQKEQAYSNVLKNMTLANKILQELLKNYERLEQIYQSEELLQNDLSSSETEQTFKSFMSSKQKFKQKDRLYEEHTSSPYLGTAMIYDSESVENILEDAKQEIKEENTPFELHPNDVEYKKVIKENIKTVLNNKIKKKGITTNTSSRAKFKEISSEDTQSDEVEQIIIEIPEDISNVDDEKKDVNVVKNTLNERIIKSYSNKPNKNILGEKTRFSIQHTVPNKKGKLNIFKDALRTKNNSGRNKKVVYLKTFSPDKIWHESIKHLKKDRQQIIQKRNKKNKNDKKITVLIITNNENVNDTWKVGPQVPIFNATEVSPKIDLLSKLLRSEYGETCLQMPIKKCKKALKNLNKNICKRRFKCKSDFKSDFIQNSKDGCNKEFVYKEKTASISNNITNAEKENVEKFSPPVFRELQKKNLKKNQMQRNIKNLRDNKLQQLYNFVALRNRTLQDALLRVRKLRDKYEKKCQKQSTKKCNNACEYAVKETCSVHTCEKRKKKAIKKECKNECKKAYIDVKQRVKYSSKSDSDSESDSENDSGSDSGSDSGNDSGNDSGSD